MIFSDLAGRYFDWLYGRVCGDSMTRKSSASGRMLMVRRIWMFVLMYRRTTQNNQLPLWRYESFREI